MTCYNLGNKAKECGAGRVSFRSYMVFIMVSQWHLEVPVSSKNFASLTRSLHAD